MGLRPSAVNRNGMCDLLVDSVDGGTPPGYIEVRTGPVPATCEDASTGTLLGTLTMSNPAFGPAAAGVATASAITNDSSADATGSPEYVRVFNGSGTCLMQMDAAVGSGSANFNASIVVGGIISITSFTVTLPAES